MYTAKVRSQEIWDRMQLTLVIGLPETPGAEQFIDDNKD